MSRTSYVIPWWALPFCALIWIASAVVQAVILTFILTVKVSVIVLREIGRALTKWLDKP